VDPQLSSHVLSDSLCVALARCVKHTDGFHPLSSYLT
jgi:hypothetical protein